MTQAQNVSYHVSMEQPHTHIIDVDMRITQSDADSIDLKMAVWTPGSYLIREFSRKIDEIAAFTADGQPLKMDKISKNTWRVYTNGNNELSVQYKVYSFEWSVRTCIMDASHAYINGASLFLYLDGTLDQSSTIHIQPYKDWSVISTALKPVDPANPWVLHSPDYDTLFDSPIEIGQHEVTDFEAAGIPHKLAIYGFGNHDTDTLVKSTQKIVEAATDVFGENPCDDYTIIVHNTDGKYGGLEHSHSTSLMYPRWSYQPENAYTRWMGLMAHEYFHLWNVKRVRPKVLGPFDYENENYTEMLWVVEGTTSYYDDLLLRRADLIDVKKYLKIAAGNVTSLENGPGNKVQSVTDASFDAWVKYYRADEHFPNCCISYYLKGAVLSMILDLEIMHATKGEKSLDDVMRYLYEEIYKKQDRGYTDEEVRQVVEDMVGYPLDEFFEEYVDGTKTIDYNKYFNYAGLTLVDINQENTDLVLGISTKSDGGKLVVTRVKAGTCGYEHGINVHDEIIAIDGVRVDSNGDVDKILALHKAGDTVEILVSRYAEIKTLEVTLATNNTLSYTLEQLDEPTPLQVDIYKKWLKTDEF